MDMDTESSEDKSARSESTDSCLLASTRCIMIPELRWKIFELVAVVVDRFRAFHIRIMEKTLMTLALTCKSFSGPALDLLWRDLRGVEPLIKCLPQSLWKQDKKKLEFQRTMTLDDWAIFCKYNYRVRSLVHQCHESYMHTEMICSTEIWRALSCPPFSLPLLPNLTSLTWTEASNETFPHIQLFATPQLTKLTISVSTYGPSFTFGPSEESILSSIAKSCPSVSQFDFAQEKDDSMESVGAMLQFWSHLTSVKTGTVSEAAILHLSNLPSLRVLKCGLPSTSISTRAQELLQHDVFCALQDLHITCKSLANLEAFLEKLTIAPKVLSFLITPSRGGVDFVRTLPDLISRLSNACTHSSLQEVRLSIRVNRSADPEASIGALAFQPLFAFRNLRVLDFRADNCCIVRIDDASLLQMAKAWPHLEELYISRYSHSSYRVTLHAFVLLLWHCPRLRSVAVLIDWSTIDVHTIPPDIPYQGFSQKALTKLFINGWRIENPTSIAAFISAIAPNVRSIDGWDTDYHGYDSDGIDNSWTVVQSLIATLPMVREQGKRMILNRLARGSHNYHVIAQRGGRS